MITTTTLLCRECELVNDGRELNVVGATVPRVKLPESSSYPRTLGLGVAVVIDFAAEDVGTTPEIRLSIRSVGPDGSLANELALQPENWEQGEDIAGIYYLATLAALPDDPVVAAGGGRIFWTVRFPRQPISHAGVYVVGTTVNGTLSSSAVFELP